MPSVKTKLLIVCFCLVASYLAVAGGEPSPFRHPPDPCRRIETAYEWEQELNYGPAQSMTEAQWDEYMSKLRDPNNEVEGEPYPPAPKFAPAWLLYAYSPGQGDGIAAEDVGNPSEPGLVQVWGCNDLDCGLGYSAWTYDFGAELDLSNTTIGIVVTAPQFNAGANYIDNVSFGIQTATGKTRTWHWDVPEDIPWDTPTPITINTAQTGLAAADPPATGYACNPTWDITQVRSLIGAEICQWEGGAGTIPPPGMTINKPWTYWQNLTIQPNPADQDLEVGINIDIHQDVNRTDVNGFHLEGRIQSGLSAGVPGGGGWSDRPVLITHVDGDGNFPNFDCTIERDLTDPCENWYIFNADWWTDSVIPYCTVIHLGLEFEVTCHNIIIKPKGWWTRNGQRVGTTGVNKGFVPIPGFHVRDNILYPPDPCRRLSGQVCRTQVVRLQNGNLDGEPEPGEVDTEIVSMSLAGVSPITLRDTLGLEPLNELRVDGLQKDLPWEPVLDPNDDPVSEDNPVDFPADSYFKVMIDLGEGDPCYHPLVPIKLRPGDFLLVKQLLRFTNNAGETDRRWVFEMHEAHQQESDLGDAPDSSNNFGVAMNAYPWGVEANYPVVYQAGSPPYGAIHLAPRRVAHLGRSVTREEEADIGVDQDPTNNIIPPKNVANLDRADDGVLGLPLKLPYCREGRFRYVVNVIDPNVDLYTNVWFDFDRNGTWDDSAQCPNGPLVSEWAVKNQLLAAGTLSAGLNTVVTPAFTSWHPGDSATRNKPIWMRITLSEQYWWTGSGAGMVGNGGSGPVGGYQYGETEDYYFIPLTGRNPNPDLNLDGIVNFLEVAIIGEWWLTVPPDPCFEP